MERTLDRPRYSVASERRPVQITVEAHSLVGRLIDCQILADYAASAMGAACCPENAAPVSVAREALTKLEAILKAETGRLDEMAVAS